MVRPYTYLALTDFVYVHLKGLIWVYNGLTNPNNLDKDAGDAVAEIYKFADVSKPIVIDCKGVSGLTDHALDRLFTNVNSQKREVHFINTQKVEDVITSSKKEFCPDLKINIDDTCVAIYNNSKGFNYSTVAHRNLLNALNSKIKSFIGQSFFPYPNGEYKLLASTPIYANGEFDAAKIVSSPESFFWSSLQLADLVEKIIQEYRVGGMSVAPRILTVSLRSSPLAAAVGLLNNLQIETVDHFGPINNSHETDKSIISSCEYIYVGDFAVAGTEIKISKTYAMMKDAKLNHAVVLGSLWEKDVYKEFSLHQLVMLKECANVDYSLSKP